MSDKPDGIPGPPENEDGEVDLGINLSVLANIIDAARALEEGEDDSDEVETDPVAKAELGGEDLETQIGALNEDEQASLIALAWVGRGDYEPDEWEEALTLAREKHEADPAGYLAGLDLLGDLLAEGLAAFGIVAEEIER